MLGALSVGQPGGRNGKKAVGPGRDINLELVERGAGLAIHLANLVVAVSCRREPLSRRGDGHQRSHRLGHRPHEEAALFSTRADEEVDISGVPRRDQLHRSPAAGDTIHDGKEHHRHVSVITKQRRAFL